LKCFYFVIKNVYDYYKTEQKLKGINYKKLKNLAMGYPNFGILVS